MSNKFELITKETSVDDASNTSEDGLADMTSMIDYPDLEDVLRLQKTQHFIEVMQKVEDELQKSLDTPVPDTSYSWDDDEEGFQLISSGYQLFVHITNEIDLIFCFILDHYKFRFPELRLWVPHRVDYARVVKKIGNETDLSLVHLHDILPTSTIASLTHESSVNTGKPLPEEYLKKTLDACDRAIALDLAMTKIFDLAKFKMGAERFEGIHKANNLMLARTLGGLPALAERPRLNYLPAKRKPKEEPKPPTSFVDFFKKTQTYKSICPPVRKRVCKFLAGF